MKSGKECIGSSKESKSEDMWVPGNRRREERAESLWR